MSALLKSVSYQSAVGPLLFLGSSIAIRSLQKCAVCTATRAASTAAAPKKGLDAETIAVIKATAPVVAQHAREITNEFYKTLFVNYPVTKEFFNMANQGKGRQPQALANAIIAYATNIENVSSLKGALDLMAYKHCGLQVLPAHYQIVHDNLMKAVGTVLGSAVTPEIATAWSKAVMELARVLIELEESMYATAEARAGGFRGWHNFTISHIEEVSRNVRTFRLTANDPLLRGFDFTPGQFLSIRVTLPDGTKPSPRHYTVTSKPGENFFEITVKNIDGGLISGYLHRNAKVGTTVEVSPPFGGFSAVRGRKGVLISAGIGMTPMKEFLDVLGNDCVLAVHVDKTQGDVPFYSYFQEKNANRNEFHYTAGGRRPNARDMAAGIVQDLKNDSLEYYICGPPDFMKDVAMGLRGSGVSGERIHWEAFGPQLSCPV